jgi:Cof subfamily protein (haloacid dehalogenase superfamily)
MQRKLIFFDIDGTLLDGNKRLPSSTIEAISTLKEKGHEVAIATGRAPFMYRQIREKLNITSYISFNGQYIVSDNEVFYKNPILKSEIENLRKHATSNDHPLVYMDHEGMKVSHQEHPHVIKSMEDLKINPPEFGPEYYMEREIYQALIYCEANNEEQYITNYENLHFIRWHQYSTDVLPKGGSKGVGLEKLAKHYNIKQEDVIAFGDGLNDIEMLEYAGIGVGMGNGHPKALQAADFVTDSPEENGIYHALKKLALI